MKIRDEAPADAAAIAAVHEAAFETDLEARIVDRLRDEGALKISLVAEDDGAVVGHVAGSPVTNGIGLAPVGVLPLHQGRGIGSALCRAFVERARSEGYEAAVVLGDPAFYPRFGFVPAARHGLRCEFDVPTEAFMVMALGDAPLPEGLVRYDKAFSQGS